MADAVYHRAWRARAKEKPGWIEHRQQTHRDYIQRKKSQSPEWYEKRKVAKRIPNPKKPWANHVKLTTDQIQARRRAYYQLVKREVLVKYGGICDCCGETDLKVLSIDHIGNGRPEGRKRHGMNLYAVLRRSNFPAGYRVLCLNCNMALGFYGYCPHKGVPDKSLSKMQKALRKLKAEVVAGYGGKCVNCGESTIEFLEIDHIEGGGRQHLESLTRRFYNVLKDQNYPAGYQVLCANCNWRKYIGKTDNRTEKEAAQAPIRVSEHRSSIVSFGHLGQDRERPNPD